LRRGLTIDRWILHRGHALRRIKKGDVLALFVYNGDRIGLGVVIHAVFDVVVVVLVGAVEVFAFGIQSALIGQRDIGRDQFTILVGMEARPGGDQLADDNVLLQAVQTIYLAFDGCAGQHFDGVLEARCRQEAVGVQGRFGDPQQYRGACRWFLVLRDQLL